MNTAAIPTAEHRREAMPLGTPAGAADSGGHVEAIRNSETGIPVPPVRAISAIHRASLA
jgi:hypothetical protein